MIPEFLWANAANGCCLKGAKLTVHGLAIYVHSLSTIVAPGSKDDLGLHRHLVGPPAVQKYLCLDGMGAH